MTIEEIIKEAFSQGWNASHECATDYYYEYALKNCLSELDSKVKKLNIPIVSNSVYCDCDNPTKYTDANNDTYCSWCGKDFKQ
jgi:hypothetical protein